MSNEKLKSELKSIISTYEQLTYDETGTCISRMQKGMIDEIVNLFEKHFKKISENN